MSENYKNNKKLSSVLKKVGHNNSQEITKFVLTISLVKFWYYYRWNLTVFVSSV